MIGLAMTGQPRSADVWRRPLLRLLAVTLGLCALFARDGGDMVAIWTGDRTYNHCLLVGPVVAVLVWLRRRELARLTPGRWSAPLLWVGAAALAWLVGELAGVGQIRHLALVAMLQGSVAVCLGRQLTRGLLFPLAYLVFLVPFGAELVPPLQQLTAILATGLLHIGGVAASLDGVFITTPAGWFEVAEACSGISFLIATVAWGALVANLLFTSTRHRATFLVACVALPVLANGLRAWATVAAAEWVGVERAGGFDHIVYGWFFFALVLALLLAGGWRWFERAVDDPAFDADRIRSLPAGDAGTAAVLACFALPLLAFAWSALALGQPAPSLAHSIDLPTVAGWERVAADPAVPAWTPHYDNADHYLIGSYDDGTGRRVELAVALFGRQGEGREVTGYGQGAIPPEGTWAWSAGAAAPDGATGVRMVGPGQAARLAWTFNVVGGRITGPPVATKLATLATRLRLSDPAAGAVIVSAGGTEAQARPTMTRFVRDLGPVDRLVAGLIARSRDG